MLRVKCACRRVYQVSESHAGRSIRCRCGRMLEVRHTADKPGTRVPAYLTATPESLRREQWRTWLGRLRIPLPRSPVTRAARLTVWSVSAVSVLATVLLWGFGDRWYLGTVLLFGARWLLLVPVLVAIIAAVFFDRRSLILAIGTLVVTLGPFMGYRTGVRGLLDFRSGAGPILRVSSLNAASRAYVAFLFNDQLTAANIDIVGVQECTSAIATDFQRSGWHIHQEQGLCLFSRYPILEVTDARWESLDAIAAAGFGRSGAAALYTVQTPLGIVYVANVHFETPRKGLEKLRDQGQVIAVEHNARIRRIGSRRAAEFVGIHRDSVIVLGDFNMPVESTIYREHWSDYANAFSRVGRGGGATRYDGRIRARIDHILYGREWSARRAWVGGDVGSDHRPVFAELRRNH
jgi:vancomycin resistance protein VanJ